MIRWKGKERTEKSDVGGQKSALEYANVCKFADLEG